MREQCRALFMIPLCAGAAVWLTCSDDPVAPGPSPAAVVQSDSALVDTLAAAYRRRDAGTFASLLADRDDAAFLFVGSMGGRTVHWGAERERRIHRRMFDHDAVAPGEPPVPAGHWVQDLTLSLTRIGSFAERTDLYFDATQNPQGLDPERWRATTAAYMAHLEVYVPDYDFDPVHGPVNFVVIEDLHRSPRWPGKFLLYRWEDWTLVSAAGKGESVAEARDSWTRIKDAYAGILGLDSPSALVDSLARVYRSRDPAALAAFLSTAAPYRFDLAAPGLDGRTSWDADTELLAARRMFAPQTASPPVLSRLWTRRIDIDLRPLTSFVACAGCVGTLDPARWRALEATYTADVTVTTADTTRLDVDGQAQFTVLEDLTLPLGAAGKFTLLRWRDLPQVAAVRTTGFHEWLTWSELKDLYLPPPAIESEATLVGFLAQAYHEADLGTFLQLLALEPGAEYEFVRDRPDAQSGEAAWGAREDVRIHDRMFRPDSAEPPLAPGLRQRHADVRFTPLESFSERVELYRSAANPDGLDPARWRVRAALHASDATFYRSNSNWLLFVHEPVRFTVLEDRDKPPGTPKRFTLYRWECTNPDTMMGNEISWTDHRLLYR